MNIHQPKVRIRQPNGIRYMIQEYHYSKNGAQDYIDMLIEKSEIYIARKRRGEFVAPLMTLEQLETQLLNIKQFEVVDYVVEEVK